MDKTVVIFGAGATKACDGPLTDEILPDAFTLRPSLQQKHMALLDRFLRTTFHVPPMRRRTNEHYPPLPLLLSLIDTALDRQDAFTADWSTEELRKVREALEYAIFALLEVRLRSIKPHYDNFLTALYAKREPQDVTLISLNYDLIADNAMPRVAKSKGAPVGLADYGCDIATDAYRQMQTFGTLLKPHGSLNWVYCPNCHRLDIGLAGSGFHTMKMLNAFYPNPISLDHEYAQRGTTCRDCRARVRPVLITPTHLKDYRNPHIARVWYEAGRVLRQATRAIFVGYSMPDDDVAVVYLFKRGLSHLDPRAITVVEKARGVTSALDRNAVGLRYRALFGPDIDWHTEGFGPWIETARKTGFAPPRRRARR